MRLRVTAGFLWKKRKGPWGYSFMCAIIDANIAHEVFGTERPPAGDAFFNRVNQGGIRLVVGGKLRCELASREFQAWALQAQLAGTLLSFSDDRIQAREQELQASGPFKSNDVHILALAQISGARLLYSNDQNLHQDFKNSRWIAGPRGRIYSTLRTKELTPGHKRLLGQRNLCRA